MHASSGDVDRCRTDGGAGAYRAWKSWAPEGFGAVQAEDAASYELELRRSGVPMDRKLRVLELGFGNGSFASWVRSRGWPYMGTELDPELVSRARQHGVEAHQAGVVSLASIAHGRAFDLIVAFDVLEHMTIREIEQLLTELRGVLVRDGRVVARFPSGDSPFSRAIQHGDLTHQSIIGSGIITQLALQTGFRVAQVRACSLPIFGLGFRRAARRLGIRVARVLITRFVNAAFNDNQARVVEPNMLVVLTPCESLT